MKQLINGGKEIVDVKRMIQSIKEGYSVEESYNSANSTHTSSFYEATRAIEAITLIKEHPLLMDAIAEEKVGGAN